MPPKRSPSPEAKGRNRVSMERLVAWEKPCKETRFLPPLCHPKAIAPNKAEKWRKETRFMGLYLLPAQLSYDTIELKHKFPSLFCKEKIAHFLVNFTKFYKTNFSKKISARSAKKGKREKEKREN